MEPRLDLLWTRESVANVQTVPDAAGAAWNLASDLVCVCVWSVRSRGPGSPLGALVVGVGRQMEGMMEVSWGRRSRDLVLSNRGHMVLVHVSSDKKSRVSEVEPDLDLYNVFGITNLL